MEKPQTKMLSSLTDDELEAIAGGYILDMGEGEGDSRYFLIQDRTGRALAKSGDLEEVQRQIDKSNACAPEGYVLATKGVITFDQYKQMYGRTTLLAY